MGRSVNPDVPEAGYISKRQFENTGSIAASDFAVVADLDRSKQINFDPNSLPVETTYTLKAPTTSGNVTLTLPTASGTLVTTATETNSFSVIQPDTGTSPTASSPTDTLTITGNSSPITVTGDSVTKTITLGLNKFEATTTSRLFTPVNFGTVTNLVCRTQRLWDRLTGTILFTAGTATSSTAELTLPAGLTVVGAVNEVVGFWSRVNSTASNVTEFGSDFSGPVFLDPVTDNTKLYLAKNSVNGSFFKITPTSIMASGDALTVCLYGIQISQWA